MAGFVGFAAYLDSPMVTVVYGVLCSGVREWEMCAGWETWCVACGVGGEVVVLMNSF